MANLLLTLHLHSCALRSLMHGIHLLALQVSLLVLRKLAPRSLLLGIHNFACLRHVLLRKWFSHRHGLLAVLAVLKV